MMAMDIHKTRFEAVEICGVPALFTVERVRRSELPNGIFAYDMQTSAEDWSQPCLLACHITVEHYGTVLTGQRIDLPESGYRDLAADDFSWPSSTDRPTIAEFVQRHGLHIKPRCHAKTAPTRQRGQHRFGAVHASMAFGSTNAAC